MTDKRTGGNSGQGALIGVNPADTSTVLAFGGFLVPLESGKKHGFKVVWRLWNADSSVLLLTGKANARGPCEIPAF